MKHILLLSILFAFFSTAFAGDWFADDTGYGNSIGPEKLDTNQVEKSLWKYIEFSTPRKIEVGRSYTFMFKSIAEDILRIYASCYEGNGSKKVSLKDCSFVVKYKYKEGEFYELHYYEKNRACNQSKQLMNNCLRRSL